MKIWANCIVHNEENFIWFAMMSVIDYVDKILVWDTGSTDKTVQIIQEIEKIKKGKIIFKEVGEVSDSEFPKVRQQMLEQSDCDFILILDGDEIWWEDSIKKLVQKIEQEGNKIGGIVVPMKVPVGDIYHLQEEAAGQYKLLGRKGHLNLRAISKHIPGLHVDWPYGKESYFDEQNQLVQDRDDIIFLNAAYLHVTHLKRSSSKSGTNKFKYEVGEVVPKDFKFPQVLYSPYPSLISSPWIKISGIDLQKARLLTPLRKIKRRFSL